MELENTEMEELTCAALYCYIFTDDYFIRREKESFFLDFCVFICIFHYSNL